MGFGFGLGLAMVLAGVTGFVVLRGGAGFGAAATILRLPRA
jgi:hypothetical protein